MAEYTLEDEALIDQEYDSLMQSCEKIFKNEEDANSVKKAFFFAKEAHKGVRRKSGEPYITHPIAVAHVVVDEIGLGVKAVIASLLHDVVEDTEYTVEDIESMYGAKIASMVDGLTKMSGVFNADTSQQAESFRKVLLTLSDDVRVILIKIADRLHNMRTLGSMAPNKQIKITSETIYLFAPLAYRLGLYGIKTELEDLCLKYKFPEQYEEIKTKILQSEAQREEFISKFNSPIIKRLKDSKIDFEISCRVKSISSVWAKMQRKQIPFEEVYDLFAIRIIFKSSLAITEKSQCWYIYSLITDIYTPNPERLRDWVSIPKDNGYEAIHTTVMGPDGVWAEVQIRSERMEEIAERGYAAHWKYKKVAISSDEDDFDKWLRKIRDALNGSMDNAVDFLDNFKMSLYTSEIVVFTPKGEPKKLPLGATALDFAYDIHTKIGQRALGAKINHKIQPIYKLIKSGDQIEIITADTISPKLEWLEHVVTAKAKQSIKNHLKRDKISNIESGINILEQKLKDFGIKPSARVFRKILPAYECSNKDEFYSNLATGIVNLDNLAKVLRENAASKMLKFWSLQLSNPFRFLSNEDSKHRKVTKENSISTIDPEFKIAGCCEPIPGDKVIGYKDQESGNITVHKTSCNELTRLASQHGEYITSVKWSSQKAMSYLSLLNIRGIDRMGVLMEIVQVITGEFNINIRELKVQSHDGIFEGTISVYVKNTKDLNEVIGNIYKIKGIEKVRRVSGS